MVAYYFCQIMKITTLVYRLFSEILTNQNLINDLAKKKDKWYINPNGYLVMQKGNWLQRAYCCFCQSTDYQCCNRRTQ